MAVREERAPGRSAYLAYRALSTVAAVLPSPLASVGASLGGLVMARLDREQREIVRRNLRRVLGPRPDEEALDRAVAEAFGSYARYWVESARLSPRRPDEVASRFTIEGFEPAREALDGKRGAVFALPHLGSWEIGGYWLTLQGHPMTTVMEPVHPTELFEWLKDKRSRLGLKVLPLGPRSTEQLIATLRAGGLVGLVADRDLVGTGVEVSFFGEKTTLPAGPAVLARRTGAPLFPVAVYQEPHGRFHGVVRPALEVPRSGHLRAAVSEVTAQLAQEFEELIRAAPSQWHMFQPNWPSDRTTA